MSVMWDSWQQQVERIVDAGDNGVVALMHLQATLTAVGLER